MRERHKKILLVSSILIFIGLLMVTSASWPESLATTNNKTGYSYTIKQMISVVIGFFAIFFFSRIPYKFYYRHAGKIFLLCFIFSFAVFVPQLGGGNSAAMRWVKFGPISVMPSDFLKLSSIIFSARFISKSKAGDLKDYRSGLIPMIIIIILSTFPVLIQPDLSTSIVIATSIISLFFLSGLPYLHFGLSVFFGLIATILSIVLKKTGYSRTSRIAGFLDPLGTIDNAGWQVSQSLFAISLGRLFGVGYRHSTQKYKYLTQAHNDYIFAILCEEFGFIGACIVIGLFVYLIYQILKLALETKDKFAQVLSLGILLLIGVQAFLNISVALSLLPSTGLTLPFISYGGSSIIIYMSMIGILTNISLSNDKIRS